MRGVKLSDRLKGNSTLGSIGFIFGVLAGIICLFISLLSLSGQQSVDFLQAIYFVILSLVFFKIGSWSIKRTDALKED
jgi:hypothetical protein